MTEAAQAAPYVGQSLRRREDLKFLTGNGRYVDDINMRGILYLAILRSPHAHALITDIDLSTARAAAGVRLALAGADLSGEIGNIKPNWVVPGTVVPERPVMAVDRVRFVGECVALVVAETRDAAHDALELIDVAYEALPAVVDEEAAIGDGAPQLHEKVPKNITTHFKIGGGDYAAAARQADHLLHLRLVNNRLIPTCLETRSILAEPGIDGRLTIYLPSQVPHMHRRWIAETVGIPGAFVARGCARHRWRLRGEDAPLPRGAALRLSGPRAEMSGQVVGIAVGKSSGDQSRPGAYGIDRGGLPQ